MIDNIVIYLKQPKYNVSHVVLSQIKANKNKTMKIKAKFHRQSINKEDKFLKHIQIFLNSYLFPFLILT